MTNVLAVRVPRVIARVLALAGLTLAAVTADVSTAAAQQGMQEGMQAMQQLFSDPAIANYRLTSANLDKYIRAANALEALEGEDIDLEERLDMDDPENLNVAELSAAFDSEPRIKNAINGAGLTSREFLTFTFAMIQATFGMAMAQMGGEDAINGMPAGVLKDNIQFIIANQDRLEALGEDN